MLTVLWLGMNLILCMLHRLSMPMHFSETTVMMAVEGGAQLIQYQEQDHQPSCNSPCLRLAWPGKPSEVMRVAGMHGGPSLSRLVGE